MYDKKLTVQREKMTMDTKKPTRIVVMGEKGVGKTALITRCIENKFQQKVTPGKDLSHRFNVTFGKKAIVLDIVDFNGKNDALISCADGFILCYSITDRRSFDAIDSYLDKIVDANIKHPKIAIIGNKSDLYNNREVTSNEGLQLAKEINGLFYETSARVPVIDIRQVFYDLYKAVKNAKKNRKGQRNSLELDSPEVYSVINLYVINTTGLLGYSRFTHKSYFSGFNLLRKKP